MKSFTTLIFLLFVGREVLCGTGGIAKPGLKPKPPPRPEWRMMDADMDLDLVMSTGISK